MDRVSWGELHHEEQSRQKLNDFNYVVNKDNSVSTAIRTKTQCKVSETGEDTKIEMISLRHMRDSFERRAGDLRHKLKGCKKFKLFIRNFNVEAFKFLLIMHNEFEEKFELNYDYETIIRAVKGGTREGR